MKNPLQYFPKIKLKYPIVNYIEAIFLFCMHFIIMVGLTVLAVFSDDWFTLIITGIILTIVLFINILLRECPLERFQSERIDENEVSFFLRKFRWAGYTKEKHYTIELTCILMLITIIHIKIIFRLFKRNAKKFLLILDKL